jgi:hypothetical protein
MPRSGFGTIVGLIAAGPLAFFLLAVVFLL